MTWFARSDRLADAEETDANFEEMAELAHKAQDLNRNAVTIGSNSESPETKRRKNEDHDR